MPYKLPVHVYRQTYPRRTDRFVCLTICMHGHYMYIFSPLGNLFQGSNSGAHAAENP